MCSEANHRIDNKLAIYQKMADSHIKERTSQTDKPLKNKYVNISKFLSVLFLKYKKFNVINEYYLPKDIRIYGFKR